MTEPHSKTLTRYNVVLCEDGYYIADEQEIIVSDDRFNTPEEAQAELEKWIVEAGEAEFQEFIEAGKYAYACGERD